MTTLRCRTCGREFSEGEQFCSQDGTRLYGESAPAVHELSELPDISSDGSVTSNTSSAGRDVGDPLVGTTLGGRYQILRVIGEGGMGVVYEALHVLIEKQVAIKVLRDTFTGRADVVERFRQEAKSASKIGHPNIVYVSDFGETPTGQSYIVMEMLIGEDLADVLARERALSPERSVGIAYQTARALHATHNKGIVHRDLKPENIYLVERDGAKDVVKVVDFGVAKMNDVEVRPGRRLTRTGMLFGTPEYMSPEQSLGKPVDHRVDIYALGAILFELVTGRVPFVGDNFMEILSHHGHSPLPTLRSVNKTIQVSSELESVIRRALAKDPAQRYPTMGAFADDLRNVPEMTGAGLLELTPHGARVGAPLAGAQAEAPSGSRPSAPLRDHERSTLLDAPAVPPLSDGELVTRDSDHGGGRRRAGDTRTMRVDRVDLDEVQDAVLLTPGAEFKHAAKVGLTLVVLASALLGAFILLRSRPALPTITATTTSSAESDATQPAGTRHATATNASSAPSSAVPTSVPQVQKTEGAHQPAGVLSGGSGALAGGVSASQSRAARAARRVAAAVAAAGGTRSGATAAAVMRRNTLMTRAEPQLEALVEVQVRTVPQGANVSVLGTGARCDPTPCSLLVPRDRAVTLRAEARNRSVQRTFRFTRESAVELHLANGRGRSKTSNPNSTLTKASQAPHAPSDLKVPSIFRERR